MDAAFQVFNDPDVILAQTQAGVSSSPLLQAQVQAGAVTNIGGATGTSITIVSGGSAGFSITPSGTPGQLSLSVGVSNAATARGALGLGALAVLGPAAASADTAPAQGVAYVQADVQAILTELRDLKAKLRTALILTP